MPSKTIVLLQQYRELPHEWAIGLTGVPCHEPCCCLASAVCFPCASFRVRKEALGGSLGDGRYQCCQGYYFGCCSRCVPCQRTCPGLCLCLEVHICPHVSIMATRHYLQDQYKIRNTCGENCCLELMICAECVMCCLDEDNPIRELLHCCIHAACCVVSQNYPFSAFLSTILNMCVIVRPCRA